MKIYLIKDRLEEVTLEAAAKHEYPYVSIATHKEFIQNSEFFDMGIDLEFDLTGPTTTKAEVNYDAIIGSFSIPDRNENVNYQHSFVFAFDEKGIVFITGDRYVNDKIENIIRTKKWRLPSLERFIFDFLEQITDDDLRILEKYEARLDELENIVQSEQCDKVPDEIADIRSKISDFRLNYGQLLDLSQELEENENNFFDESNLRFFNMYSNRIKTLMDISLSIQEHCIQVRDLHHAMLDAKQNRLMAILTIIATIFMPLTLVVGWYGMNFVYMPELTYRYSYPIVIGVCLLIVAWCIFYFKKNKWL